MTESKNLKTVPARQDDPINRLTVELHDIVKHADTKRLDAWIAKYLRKIGIEAPINEIPGIHVMTPSQECDLKISANLGIVCSQAAVWSEQFHVDKGIKTKRAEFYFLDVTGKIGRSS